ncbi:MAG: 3-hydroxyacyl-ACP dehydratase [Bacteroidia bacterium]
MLLNDFFKITTLDSGEKYTAHIELNANHRIFSGHFPGNPITPGVCLTQMVKETLEQITGKKLQMLKGDNIKFTAILNPLENPEVTMTLGIKEKEPGVLQADAAVRAENASFFTFKGSFKTR